MAICPECGAEVDEVLVYTEAYLQTKLYEEDEKLKLGTFEVCPKPYDQQMTRIVCPKCETSIADALVLGEQFLRGELDD